MRAIRARSLLRQNLFRPSNVTVSGFARCKFCLKNMEVRPLFQQGRKLLSIDVAVSNSVAPLL
jgi:hypothetical protein